jgi:hypothetical protein
MMEDFASFGLKYKNILPIYILKGFKLQNKFVCASKEQ